MPFRKPLVLGASGYVEELQAGDYISDPTPDIVTMTGGGAVAVRDAVYVDGSGKVQKANAAAIGTMPAIGFALEVLALDSSGKVQIDGIVSGFTGLTPGAPVFVDATTPGAVTQTPPTGVGKVVQIIGHAFSATEVEIERQQPIKRG